MEFNTIQEQGHYVMYLNGAFYGSYDTIGEAGKDIEMIQAEREGE